MIEESCFSEKWIQKQRNLLGRVDPTLLEKTIYAFELLGRLCEHHLDFVFKGGTCLLLILPGFRRLSIDIDIVTQAAVRNLCKIFDEFIKESPFFRWIEDPRTAIHIPKKQFKFFFKSAINNREDYVLLDVLSDDHGFPKIQLLPINLDIFEVKKETLVKMPAVNSLVGDKLTAFAPSTIGILYDENRSMQIIRAIKNEQTIIFRNGIRKLQSHLINIRYSREDAKLSAAKIALVASILKKDRDFPDPDKIKFTPDRISSLKDIQLEGKYQVLNRLKSILPEAFYYWYLTTLTV